MATGSPIPSFPGIRYARTPGDRSGRSRPRQVAHELITSHGARRDRPVTPSGTPGGNDVGSRHMGSVIKKRRKRMAKKKHRKLLKKTRVQRRNKK
jgi:hypothetical protein